MYLLMPSMDGVEAGLLLTACCQQNATVFEDTSGRETMVVNYGGSPICDQCVDARYKQLGWKQQQEPNAELDDDT